MVIENSSNILQTIYNENASSFTLSKSQEELVYNVIHDRHQNDFFKDEFITPEDTQELWNNKPVNDNVINTYFNRIVADNSKQTGKKVYAFNTQFITKLSKDGASSVKKWTKYVDLFAHELILMPVHLNNHWTLIVIDLSHKEIRYYDPYNYKNLIKFDSIIKEYFNQEYKDKIKWNKSYFVEDFPKLNNRSDCGIFVCKYAEYVSRGESDFNFDQSYMPQIRKLMAYEIITKKLIKRVQRKSLGRILISRLAHNA